MTLRRFSLWQKWIWGVFGVGGGGVKYGRCVGLTTWPRLCADWKSCELSNRLRDITGIGCKNPMQLFNTYMVWTKCRDLYVAVSCTYIYHRALKGWPKRMTRSPVDFSTGDEGVLNDSDKRPVRKHYCLLYSDAVLFRIYLQSVSQNPLFPVSR